MWIVAAVVLRRQAALRHYYHNECPYHQRYPQYDQHRNLATIILLRVLLTTVATSATAVARTLVILYNNKCHVYFLP